MTKNEKQPDVEGPTLRQDALPVALLVLLGGAFLFELVTVSGVPFVRDVQVFFLPQKHILREALQEGRLPLWTSLISTGRPLLANFQSGVFYPPHWLFAVVPIFAGFNWLIVLHLVLGGAGTYLLCRETRHSRAASWIGAVSFMLGGYLVSLTNLVNALQTAAWAPLMAVTVIRHARHPRPGSFSALVAVHLLGFLAGAPYTFLLAAALSAGFGFLRVRRHEPEGSWKTVAVTLAFAAAAVAGLAAAQLLPTLQMVAESSRSAGLELGEAATYSLDPVRLLHLIFPNDFSDPAYRYGHKLQLVQNPPWLLSIYVGAVSLVLVLFSASDRERRTEAAFWTGAAVLGLVLTLGRHAPLFGVLREWVPGMDAFRYPEKFFLLTGLSIPMLAALGFSALRRGKAGNGATIGASAVASAAVAAVVFWRSSEEAAREFVGMAFSGGRVAEHVEFAYRTWVGTLDQLAVLLVASVMLIGFYRRGWLGEKLFGVMFVVLVSADFWLAHRQMVPLVDPAFYRQSPAVASMMPVKELSTTYRYRASPFNEQAGSHYVFGDLPVSAEKWVVQNTVQPNVGALYGFLTVDSRDAIQLRRGEDREGMFHGMPDAWRWRLLEVTSVKYLYSPEDFDEEYYADRTPLDSIPGALYELRDPLPRAYLGEPKFYRGDEDVLSAVLDPARRGERPVALLADSAERAPAELREWAASRGIPRPPDTARAAEVARDSSLPRAEIVEDSGNEVRVRVEPSRAEFLVLTDAYYPGWRAYVDGEERPILRANYFFRAVPLRPGDSEVAFRYTSQPLRAGAWISGASLVLLAAGMAGWRRRRARS